MTGSILEANLEGLGWYLTLLADHFVDPDLGVQIFLIKRGQKKNGALILK